MTRYSDRRLCWVWEAFWLKWCKIHNFGCRRYTRLIGHLPALVHPRPRRVLVICLGSGMTLNCFRRHDAVETIDCADISEGVVRAGQGRSMPRAM